MEFKVNKIRLSYKIFYFIKILIFTLKNPFILR
jgi:hypothetical protein